MPGRPRARSGWHRRGRRAAAAAWLVLAGLLCTAEAPRAAPPSKAASPLAAIAGGWDLSDAKSGRKCRLTLSQESAGAGYALGAPPACRMAVPLLVQATAWTLTTDRHIEFLDGAGKAVLSFVPSGAPGRFSATAEGKTFTLVPAGGAKEGARGAAVAAALEARPQPVAQDQAPAAALPALAPEQVVGTWGLARERYKPVCSIDLLAQKGRKAGTFLAKLSGGCIDPGLKVFNPVAWRTDRGRLVLVAAKGHEQAFAPGKDGVFSKDPPSQPELYMRKQ